MLFIIFVRLKVRAVHTIIYLLLIPYLFQSRFHYDSTNKFTRNIPVEEFLFMCENVLWNRHNSPYDAQRLYSIYINKKMNYVEIAYRKLYRTVNGRKW